MISEKDIRLLNERRKEYERAAREHDKSRDARLHRRNRSSSAWSRIAALFL